MVRVFDRTAAAACLWLGAMAATDPILGQAITPASLHGSTIVATVNYEIGWKRGEAALTSSATATYRLNIAADGTYTGSVTRTQVAGRNAGANVTEQFSGTLGRTREATGAIRGLVVWTLSGNTLTMMRSYEMGGHRTTITFGPGGKTCTVRAPFMRETGSGQLDQTRNGHWQRQDRIHEHEGSLVKLRSHAQVTRRSGQTASRSRSARWGCWC